MRKAFEEVNVFSNMHLSTFVFIHFLMEELNFVAVVASVIAAMCICGQKVRL